MNEIDVIDKYLSVIVDYYRTLEGHNNLEDFLKREVKCVDEGLDLIDLSILPISQNYIEECRIKQREFLKKELFLEESKKLNMEIVAAIFKVKKNSAMSKQEQDVFDAITSLFPIEIEPHDLLIEHFTDILLCYSVKKEDILRLLYKHFKDIIDGN
jgi:hypothetical protein